MRKLIAIVSVGLSIGFAVALANAQDMTSEPNNKSAEVKKESHPRAEVEKKSCTDSNGVTWQKGESGFEDCLHAQAEEKAKKPEGQAGTAEGQSAGQTSEQGGASSNMGSGSSNQ